MPLVVIVDDRITNRRILSKLATTLEAGTTVRDFAEPPAALAWLRQNTPDLVVTDFNMPGMNGAEFTQAIRREPSLANVPVVVVTAYEDKSYRYQALEAGATDFLLSPVDHHEFRSRCRNLLTLERQRRQLKERAELLERKLMRDSEAHAAALQQSHQRLLRVIDAVPAMISATDNAGRVVFMNSFEAQLLGTTPDEAAGRTPADIDPHGYGTRSLALDRMIFDLGEAPAPFDETISFNGDDRTFHLTKMALRDGAGRVANVVTVGFDITERKAASRALEEAKNAAETANRLKTEFLANMSHELRTPLNAIIGFASMMNQQVLGPVGTPRYVDYAHDIAGSASHLLDIINDILDVSRIEAGVLDLHDEWVEMATTINDAVRAVSEEASGRRVQIVINMEPELPPLRADSARLQQVIVNLLSNAVKASSDGGEVYVNALERDGSIIVAIADRGCGMDSAEISTALSRFGYLENVMTRRHAGAGLGLPLANDLVRLHGGRLDVESRKGQGTTMTVILPIRRPEPGHQGAEPVAGLDSPLSSQGSV